MSYIEPIIQKFLQRNISSKEEKILHDWIKQDPQNRNKLFKEKDLLDASLIDNPNLSEIELNEWIKLQEKIVIRSSKVYRIKEIIRFAAIIIISIGVGWFGHYTVSKGIFSTLKSKEIKQVESFNGQIKEIFLADGTHVWLNSGSKLKFPESFSASNRKVELSGEAYFEVVANEDKPFFVKTENHTVKVTGTRFNISEYPENNLIETTLEEGRVKIISGNIIKDLYPGQLSSFNTKTAQIRISKADLELYTTWRNGVYEFDNETIEKVFSIIERWWDVKIDYPESKLKGERITGTLRTHKPINQHFDAIRQLVPFNYEIDGDLVTITL